MQNFFFVLELRFDFLGSSLMFSERLSWALLCIFHSIMHTLDLSLLHFDSSFKWANLRFKLFNYLVQLIDFTVKGRFAFIENFLLLLFFFFQFWEYLSVFFLFFRDFGFELFVHLFYLLGMNFFLGFKSCLMTLIQLINSNFFISFQFIGFLFKLLRMRIFQSSDFIRMILFNCLSFWLVSGFEFSDLFFVIGLHIESFLLQNCSLSFETFSSFFKLRLELINSFLHFRLQKRSIILSLFFQVSYDFFIFFL